MWRTVCRTAAEAGVHEVILDLQHTATDDRHLSEPAETFKDDLSARLACMNARPGVRPVRPGYLRAARAPS